VSSHLGPLILALGLSLAGCAQGDQLDFARHHDTGAAIVSYRGTTFLASYQQDTFDSVHDPELGFQTLGRYLITPHDTRYLSLPYANVTAICRAQILGNGHALMRWGDWTLELISADASVRDYWRTLNPLPQSVTRRLVVKSVRDSLVLTITDLEMRGGI